MGAWGAGSFENDDAMDYAAAVKSSDDLARTFVAALEPGEIGAALASQVVVAAECVAAMRGHRAKAMPADLAERVFAFGKPPLSLYSDARNAVSAVLGRSELVELWAESGAAPFNRAMTELIARLNKPAKKPREPKPPKPLYNRSICSFCDQEMGEAEASMFDIALATGLGGSIRQGGWAHIACLNAALHPRHMIQHWQFDDELIAYERDRMLAERAKG